MPMRHATKFVPWQTLVALDKRVDQARSQLQRTTEVDPAFEHRVQVLIELVRKRDRALADDGPLFPPAA